MRLLRVALEGDEGNQSASENGKEKELVFYGKIKDFGVLKTATSIERQEQFEIRIPKTDKNAIEGRIRIRKTVVKDEAPKYVLTTKTKLTDGSQFESNADSSEENFIQFKYLAEYGMVKERHLFPVEGHPNLNWEVDVFLTPTGGYQEWCKIDLEYQDSELTTIPTFPFELDELITNQDGQRTEEEEIKVRMLYDTVFRVPNPFLSKL